MCYAPLARRPLPRPRSGPGGQRPGSGPEPGDRARSWRPEAGLAAREQARGRQAAAARRMAFFGSNVRILFSRQAGARRAGRRRPEADPKTTRREPASNVASELLGKGLAPAPPWVLRKAISARPPRRPAAPSPAHPARIVRRRRCCSSLGRTCAAPPPPDLGTQQFRDRVPLSPAPHPLPPPESLPRQCATLGRVQHSTPGLPLRETIWRIKNHFLEN